MGSRAVRPTSWLRLLGCCVAIAASWGQVRAQDPPPAPDAAETQAVSPRLPSASPPSIVDGIDVPAAAPSTAGMSREAALEQRLKQMEDQNRKLGQALESTLRQYGQQMDSLQQEIADLRSRVGQGGGGGAGGGSGGEARAAGGSDGGGAPGGTATAADRQPMTGAPSYTLSGIRGQRQTPLKVRVGNGFEFISDDEEFQLQFHQQTQTDYRIFSPNGDYTYHDAIVFPRVRFFLNGRMTKQWEYMFSINRGFGTIDILDAWVNYHPFDEFQIKVGRFMTPFNYEQFAIQNMWLIAPERSLFTSNLGLNRQLGAQVWGQAFDKRVDYAGGVFDGPRNSYEDFNNAKDIMTYVNARPFEQGDGFFKFFNLGGSFSYGAQNNPTIPRSWRTAANASNSGTAETVAPPFYTFNSSVVERGVRSFWSGHMALFYKHLSVVGDYNSGILRYAPKATARDSVTIPVTGYSLSAGYFITGEEVDRRTIVEPLRPFSIRRKDLGPGAIELVARFHTIDFDPDMLTKSLTNPALWTNRVWSTNLGVNWYLTKYVKAFFDWQHNEFGSPVFYGPPDLKSLTNNIFWMRVQLYY